MHIVSAQIDLQQSFSAFTATMFAVFPCSRPLAFYRDCLFVAICAVCGSFLCGTTAAVPGQLDPTFGDAGLAFTRPNTAALNPNSTTLNPSSSVADAIGRTITAWPCIGNTGTLLCIVRYDATGVLDPSFGSGGLAVVDMKIFDGFSLKTLLQPDGKIVVATACPSVVSSPDICVTRVLETGAADGSFGINGQVSIDVDTGANWVYDAALQLDGRILVAASCSQPCLIMLATNGAVDTAYGSSGIARISLMVNGRVSHVSVTSQGTAYAAGQCQIQGYCIVRFAANGQADTTFALDVAAAAEVQSWRLGGGILVQADSKVLLSGYSFSNQLRILRVFDTGLMDTPFGQSGVASATPQYLFKDPSLSFDSFGNLLAGYTCTYQAGPPSTWTWEFCVTRFSPSGTADFSFGNNGNVRIPAGLTGSASVFGSAVSEASGKVLVAGTCGRGAPSGMCLVRLKGGPYNPLTCALNADANQAVDPATDALLLIRYLLGFRGDALTAGALGPNPTRTGQALEIYLASLNLDADGDGQVNALTDGLLILRAMLGLSGNALTAGAVNVSSPYVRNAQQILTWIESTHGVACLP
jgi:uncharacterized delta-60 repeat protein